MVGKTVSLMAANKAFVYTFFVALTLITLFITLIPAENLEEESFHRFDKLGHVLLFFVWTFILGFIMIITKKRKRVRLLTIFVIATFFGVAIEIVQELLPYGRFASYLDIVANMAGSLIALFILWSIQNKYQSYLMPEYQKNNINTGNSLDS